MLDKTTINAICGLIIHRNVIIEDLPKHTWVNNQGDLLEFLKLFCSEIQVAFDESDPRIRELLADGKIENPDWEALIEVCHAFWKSRHYHA